MSPAPIKDWVDAVQIELVALREHVRELAKMVKDLDDRIVRLEDRLP